MKLVLNPDELSQDPCLGLDLAHSLNVHWIEVRTAYNKNVLLLSDVELESLRAEIEGRGLQVASIASPLFKWLDAGDPCDRVDRFRFPIQLSNAEKRAAIDRAFGVARILKTRIVRVFSQIRTEQNGGYAFEADSALIYALETAKSCGVVLALENEPVCTIATAAEILRIMRCDHLRELVFWFDIGNYYAVSGELLAPIDKISCRIAYVHAKDFRGQSDGAKQFCAVGSGDVPYYKILKIIEASDTNPFVAVETHVKEDTRAALVRSVEFLRSISRSDS
jgi:sugar phosphate isomerase/epimerase